MATQNYERICNELIAADRAFTQGDEKAYREILQLSGQLVSGLPESLPQVERALTEMANRPDKVLNYLCNSPHVSCCATSEPIVRFIEGYLDRELQAIRDYPFASDLLYPTGEPIFNLIHSAQLRQVGGKLADLIVASVDRISRLERDLGNPSNANAYATTVHYLLMTAGHLAENQQPLKWHARVLAALDKADNIPGRPLTTNGYVTTTDSGNTFLSRYASSESQILGQPSGRITVTQESIMQGVRQILTATLSSTTSQPQSRRVGSDNGVVASAGQTARRRQQRQPA